MKRVLICEDEPLVGLDLEQAVYDSGHMPVGPARSYSEALELAEVTKPAIAIIDLHLADGITGAKVARVLSAQGTRIIVLSAVTDVMPALAGIPHVYISKPVDPDALASILAFEGDRGLDEPVPAVPLNRFTPTAAP